MKTLLAAIFALAFVACDRTPSSLAPVSTPIPEPVAKTDTLETTRLAEEIDRYDREPTTVNAASVKKAMAVLDGEIAELQERVAKDRGDSEAAAKMRNLESYRQTQAARFAAMQARQAVRLPAAPDARSGADKVEESASKIGNTLKDAAEKTGDAIKDATR